MTAPGNPEQAVFCDIRSSLADHFESLNTLVDRLGCFDHDVDQKNALLADTKQLTEKLALVYDDIRRFADRLPEAKNSRLDVETNVGNKCALEEWLQMHFAYLSRYGNEFSIALFEVDLGEEDAEIDRDVLTEVACRITDVLKENIRGTDKIFRYSANEFVVTLPETPLDGAMIFANRTTLDCTAAVDHPVFGGVAAARHSDSLRTLMSRADAALYQAKSQEEDSVCFHDGNHIGSPSEKPFEFLEAHVTV